MPKDLHTFQKMNISSNIVMPKGTPFTKIRRTKNFGGNVILKGETLNEAYNHVKSLILEKNLLKYTLTTILKL